jgi:beta-lactamase class D
MKKIIIRLIILSLILLVSCNKANLAKETKSIENGHTDNVGKNDQSKDVESKDVESKDSESKDNKTKDIIENTNVSNAEVNKALITEVDFSNSFNGLIGGAIFYNEYDNSYQIYNSELCKKQVSPHSTFKIISTLMGLDKNIVESKVSTMGYNGEQYWNEAWNCDLNLQEAFQLSCIWFYKKIIDQLDKEYVQNILDELNYGNKDLSVWTEEGHNDFWLGSTLKISPDEQIEILKKLFSGDNPFSQKDIDLLKEIMSVEDGEVYNIYGKTGSAKRKDGWFVGFMESKSSRTYFVIKLEDDSLELAGGMAKTIALDIIENYYN